MPLHLRLQETDVLGPPRARSSRSRGEAGFCWQGRPAASVADFGQQPSGILNSQSCTQHEISTCGDIEMAILIV